MDEELNKKLAEWAGGKYEFGHWWLRDYNEQTCNPPNFTKSLDACFKWLVPKLFELGYSCGMIIAEVSSKARYRFVVDLANTEVGVEAQDENPALAFCLAIEKLIDGGK
ncbi:hypothetical protein LCGC14_0383400 [marine sediment metagenome]|uniref:Phage ABA sandwich domain-containing protein n=1 Tax=marine sediment metagenome TaxID=412755 RepID=A0A0F9VNW7_9ZZZZ